MPPKSSCQKNSRTWPQSIDWLLFMEGVDLLGDGFCLPAESLSGGWNFLATEMWFVLLPTLWELEKSLGSHSRESPGKSAERRSAGWSCLPQPTVYWGVGVGLSMSSVFKRLLWADEANGLLRDRNWWYCVDGETRSGSQKGARRSQWTWRMEGSLAHLWACSGPPSWFWASPVCPFQQVQIYLLNNWTVGLERALFPYCLFSTWHLVYVNQITFFQSTHCLSRFLKKRYGLCVIRPLPALQWPCPTVFTCWFLCLLFLKRAKVLLVL